MEYFVPAGILKWNVSIFSVLDKTLPFQMCFISEACNDVSKVLSKSDTTEYIPCLLICSGSCRILYDFIFLQID